MNVGILSTSPNPPSTPPNHAVGLSRVTHAPRQTEAHLSGMTFQGPGDYLAEAMGKGQTFSLVNAKFFTIRPDSSILLIFTVFQTNAMQSNSLLGNL